MLWSLADAGPGPGGCRRYRARCRGRGSGRLARSRPGGVRGDGGRPAGRGVRAGTGDPVRGRAAVARLREAAAGTPPEALISAVRAQLGYAGRLLERRPTLGQHRRLLGRRGVAGGAARPAPVRRRDPGVAEASRDAAFRWSARPATPSWPPGRSRRWPCGRWPTVATGYLSRPGPARTWPRRPARLPSSSPSTRPRPGRPLRPGPGRRRPAPGRPDQGHAPPRGLLGAAPAPSVSACAGRSGLAPTAPMRPRELAVSDLFAWPTVLGPLLRREDLSEEQVGTAMGSIPSGEATPAQIAAFATGLRIKETAAEVTGLVKAMLAAAAPLAVPGPPLDTCGTGGDRRHLQRLHPGRAGRGRRRPAGGQARQPGRLRPLRQRRPAGGARGGHRPAARRGRGHHRRGEHRLLLRPGVPPSFRHAAVPRRELGVPTVFTLGPLTNLGQGRPGAGDRPARAPQRGRDPRRTDVRLRLGLLRRHASTS